MDRREALKKLGVGGAVAVSAPVLLDSFNVAHASSTALPGPGEVQNTTTLSVDPVTGAVTFGLRFPGTSPLTYPTDTTFAWGSPTPSNLKIIGSATGSSVTVDDAPGKEGPNPQFSIVLTATSPSSANSPQSYTFTYFPPSSFTVA